MEKSFGDEQYFEDFAVGDVFRAGPVALAEDDIVAFARRYDPQPFHIDPEAAAETIYGGIIASGWHTICATFRVLVDAGFLRGGGMGSPGLDKLRWIKPVRAGEALDITLTVTSTRLSSSRDDRGYVELDFAAINPAGETVMTYHVAEVVRRRSAGSLGPR